MTSEAKNCNICGKVYQSNGFSDICGECFEKDQKDFDTIREYLYAHPLAKMFEVVTNLDIPLSKIKRYLREGRLEIVEKNNHFLACEKCGKSIQSGRFCGECAKTATNNLQGMANEKSDGKQGINYRKTFSNNKPDKVSVR